MERTKGEEQEGSTRNKPFDKELSQNKLHNLNRQDELIHAVPQSRSVPCEGRAAIPMQKGLVNHVLYACMNIC